MSTLDFFNFNSFDDSEEFTNSSLDFSLGYDMSELKFSSDIKKSFLCRKQELEQLLQNKHLSKQLQSSYKKELKILEASL